MIEIGARHGGTTLWLSDLLRVFRGESATVICIDLEPPSLQLPANVHFICRDSIAPETVAEAHSVQIAGNSFAQFGGSCIGIMSNSNVVRITNNLFGSVTYGTALQHYDDQNPDPNDPYFRGNN